jgi:hypothetical protein
MMVFCREQYNVLRVILCFMAISWILFFGNWSLVRTIDFMTYLVLEFWTLFLEFREYRCKLVYMNLKAQWY